jgi:hypothetical protein
MGGAYYDREMAPSTPAISTGASYSALADQVFSQSTSLNPACVPLNRYLDCQTEDAVVVAIDVTGSMGEFPRIIFDKLPMFYGQLMLQGYLRNTSISFAAIGDVDTDIAPLQVTEFTQGSAIDQQISKIWVEGGGGDAPESYEYAAYYYACKVNFRNLRDKAFFFFTGDEVFKSLDAGKLQRFIGDSLPRLPSPEEIFYVLRQRYHVFYICRCSSTGEVPPHVKAAWAPLIGEEHILPLVNPKACIDVMLGAIAMKSKQRNLSSYVNDMKVRGQTDDRVDEVAYALQRIQLAAC